MKYFYSLSKCQRVVNSFIVLGRPVSTESFIKQMRPTQLYREATVNFLQELIIMKEKMREVSLVWHDAANVTSLAVCLCDGRLLSFSSLLNKHGG